MLFFNHALRSQLVPKALLTTAQDVEGASILAFYRLKPGERLQTDVPPLWKRPLDSDEMLSALRDLSYGKCPFCERDVRVRPYRFRPPAYAEPIERPEDRASYFWLALNWSNIFPICEDCRPGRQSYFPVVRGRAEAPTTLTPDSLVLSDGLTLRERPLLLYPGQVRRPANVWRVDVDGSLHGMDDRALLTIEHFSLNRPSLIERRGEVFREGLEELRRRELPLVRIGQAFIGQEFGGSLFLFYRQIADGLSRLSGRPVALGVRTVIQALHQAQELGLFERYLEQVIAQYMTEPAPRPAMAYSPPFAPAAATEIIREPPRVDRIEIENFKSLKKLTLDLPRHQDTAASTSTSSAAGREEWQPSGPSLLVLGENAAGKSSLLEAMALVATNAPSAAALLPPAAARRVPLNPRYMGDDTGTPVQPARIRLRFSDGSSRSIEIDPTTGALTRRRRGRTDPIVFAYGAQRLFDTSAEGADQGASNAIEHLETLFRPGARLSNPEAWLLDLATRDPAALGEVAGALRNVIEIDGQFETIGFDPVEQRCMITLKKNRPDGTTFTLTQPFSAVSSGYRALLALICDIFAGLFAEWDRRAGDSPAFTPADRARGARTLGAIVLVDEVEAHLHPRWKLRVMTGLRMALPNVLFIATTHDPLCLRGMRRGEVVLLNRYVTAEHDHLEAVELVTGLPDFEQLTVEQLLTSDLFQLFSADDQRTDRRFASVAGILARRRSGGTLQGPDLEALDEFNAEIANALPYGRSEVTQVVQEAVADYIALRRVAGQKETSEARKRAKEAVMAFLSGLPL